MIGRDREVCIARMKVERRALASEVVRGVGD